jgi:hypothetical protein
MWKCRVLPVVKMMFLFSGFQTPFGAGPPQMNIFASTSPFAGSDFSLAELDPLKK